MKILQTNTSEEALEEKRIEKEKRIEFEMPLPAFHRFCSGVSGSDSLEVHEKTSPFPPLQKSHFLIHIFVDKETEITVVSNRNKDNVSVSTTYKQRRLINWLMLNVANAVMEINWDTYEEDELEVLERHLNQWRDIGFLPTAQWHGATAEFTLYFLNLR